MGDSRRRPERGSVLMLMPAAVLIVVVLGAIAVDSAVVFLGQRQLADAAAAAANDAVTVLVDERSLRTSGAYLIDVTTAHDAVRGWLALQDLPVRITSVDIRRAGPAAIEVRLTGEVRYVFAQAIPGADDAVLVTATATAEARDA